MQRAFCSLSYCPAHTRKAGKHSVIPYIKNIKYVSFLSYKPRMNKATRKVPPTHTREHLAYAGGHEWPKSRKITRTREQLAHPGDHE